jgi:hypothetical protein
MALCIVRELYTFIWHLLALFLQHSAYFRANTCQTVYTRSRRKTKMSAEFHDPDWTVGCKVILAVNDSRGLNHMGTLPGLLTRQFGLDAHVILLPFGRRTHEATVFCDRDVPDHDEAIRSVGAIVLGVASQLAQKPDHILLHASHYALHRYDQRDQALFDSMPDFSRLIVPAQREGC